MFGTPGRKAEKTVFESLSPCRPEPPPPAFVGHRTAGQLRVERERNDHPGVCRGVGLFGPDVMPENCRDREQLLGLLADEDDG